MSYLTRGEPQGVLRNGWTATVGDYAIDGGWVCKGSLLVVGDSAGGITAFESTSGVVRWQHPAAHENGLLAMAIHPSGEIVATSGQDGRIALWNAEDGELRHATELGNGWVETLAWSSNGELLAASMSRRVHVVDLAGATLWSTEDHPSTVSAIAWSGSEELATACYGRVSFFSASSGQLNQKLEWKGSLVSLVLSPDGDVVACGSQDNSVHFWRRSSGQDSMMSGYHGKPSVLVFEDAGKLMATGGGESVTVWNFEGDGPEGTRPGVLKLHVQFISALAFVPKGRRLASGARDGGVAVWDLRSDGEGIVVAAALVDEVISALAWRPDGRALAALDAKGGVTAWRVRER